MAKTLTLNGSNEYFGFKENKQLSFVATQKMYRRTVEYNRELVGRDLEDAKLQQEIQKYWNDVEQLTNMIEDIRLSTLDDEKKFAKIEELQRVLETKENPAADGEYLLRSVDRDIESLDAAVDYLHDVIDDFLSPKQRDIIDDANGTDTIDLARRVASLILGIKEDEEKSANKDDVVSKDNTDDSRVKRLVHNYQFWDNLLKDLDYAEQQALYYLHIPPTEYENQPYERMMEVLAAESRDDRPMSGREYLAQQNLDIEKANQQLQKKGGA